MHHSSNVAEELAKAVCKIDALMEPSDLSEQLYRIRRGRLPDLTAMDQDEQLAKWLGIRRPISVAAAKAIMSAMEERVGVYNYVTLINTEKWCVRYCFAPWLLKPDSRFSIGLCYHGRYGDAPMRTEHIPFFVHKHP